MILLSLIAAATTAASAAPETCELHLWGAVSRPSPQIVERSKRKYPFLWDRSDPLANVNVLDPALRLQNVPDATFDGFFGTDVPIRVVRHSGELDGKKIGKIKAPLSERNVNCHGDLIVANLIDIEYPQGSNPGLVAGLLGAPSGMNMKITFLRYDNENRLIYRKRDGVNGELSIPRSRWRQNPDAALSAINASVANGVRDFANQHLTISKDK